jgi:CheY-like chemotaxis protein
MQLAYLSHGFQDAAGLKVAFARPAPCFVSSAEMIISSDGMSGEWSRVLSPREREVALLVALVAYMLADLGCDTLTARSATEALGTLANDQTIEILISDINMPGLAGSELAERACSYRPHLKVILLTGGTADSRGFPLLRKPFVQSDLRRVMAETTGLC